MDVQPKLDELIALVENARSMPMSASCVVNRAEVIARLEEVKGLLPDEMAQARKIISDRDAVVEESRREAERVLAGAQEQRGALIAETDVAREAYAEAERILTAARLEAERIRGEADDYVDQKLANFEVVLTKTLSAVGRGRDKMRGRKAIDDLGEYLKAQDEAEGGTGSHQVGSLAAALDADENAPFLGHAAAVPAQQSGYPEQPAYQPAAAAPQQGGYYDTGSYPAAQSGYEQPTYESGGYEVPQYQQPAYPGGQTGVPQQGGHVQQRYDAALDETSFFDTSLIDVRQFQQDGRQGG
ncbi:cell division initiation protein [Yinghuangia seranimata]|uniref:cell division initiation protein n=1 Tax=Yinghuangia seranimata TaxID=408067 RepID=UPI00248C4DAD|nr:cell division initiation protein [Yinghuangia seranimata]MDI2129301.1 cell division initiation protein [Yinghuangia seranimata]